MYYSQIRKMDISNGEGLGVSLFVSGCPFHCPNCFNKETWDYNYGKPWTEESKQEFLSLLKNPRIKRVTILGGEPMADDNALEVRNLLREIRVNYPDKKIWLYSGYTYEKLLDNETKRSCLGYVDYLVDGLYIHELRDMKLKYRGSSNQRIIDVRASMRYGCACNKLV